MKTFAFDLEVLRNLFTATFLNVEDENERYVFYIGLGKEDYGDLLKFLHKEMTLVGYNSTNYDCPILRFILEHRSEHLVADIYSLSGMLIDDNYRGDKKILALRYPRKVTYSWSNIDLMSLLGLDKIGVSLKQVAINLKWHKIQDMPVGYAEKVTVLQLDEILAYNLNDVLITKRLYEEITPLRNLRTELSKLYHVDLSSASDSKMANLLLANIYSNELKVSISTIKDMRTVREKLLLGDCVASFVKFKTPQLQEVLDRISATIVYEYTNYKYFENVYFANCNFAIGVGGLHTVDTAGIFETDEKHIIRDMDVASYYPNLIINNNFYPAHLGQDFIRVLKRITTERLVAKRANDKVKADGMKILINSIFGKLGSKDFWLQDAKQLLSTTISGEMGLLMLVEDLYLNGIDIISCNTDGVICRIPRELENKYYEVAHNWEGITGMMLEFTTFKKYIRRDVNSYITEKEDGTTKEKGAFLTEIDLKRAYRMPIVAKALYAYFIRSIPVKDTLNNCKDIMEFCISQKTAGNFAMELHTANRIEKLQKTNRFYITKKGGRLIKKDPNTKREIGLYVGRLINILNDYDDTVPFEEYSVDLLFYEKEVMKIIDEVEPRQVALFDLTTSLRGGVVKLQMPIGDEVTKVEINNVAELNKLGKNQLNKRIETLVKHNQKIDKISPRYIYILNLDTKTMVANIYCLAKGIKKSIFIDKRAYKDNRLEIGQLVYCNKFEKLDYGHALVDYKITDKIVEEVQELI
jgi:hypothetical protein